MIIPEGKRSTKDISRIQKRFYWKIASETCSYFNKLSRGAVGAQRAYFNSRRTDKTIYWGCFAPFKIKEYNDCLLTRSLKIALKTISSRLVNHILNLSILYKLSFFSYSPRIQKLNGTDLDINIVTNDLW